MYPQTLHSGELVLVGLNGMHQLFAIDLGKISPTMSGMNKCNANGHSYQSRLLREHMMHL